MDDYKYCICCGEEVPFNRIERNDKIEFTCNYCGFPLSVEEKIILSVGEASQSAPAAPPAAKPGVSRAVKPGSPPQEKPAVPAAHGADKFSHILLADDSKLMRKMIKDLLVEKDLALRILDFENGLEITSAFAKLVSEEQITDAAIIIDINMPVMDGISAAKFIRNIESQKGMPHLPMAFFSSVKADENLRNLLVELAPANYVNKASDPDPDKLAERVEQLLAYFMQMR